MPKNIGYLNIKKKDGMKDNRVKTDFSKAGDFILKVEDIVLKRKLLGRK